MTLDCASDFAFPHDAIVAEATPNTETTLIADLNLLKDLNTSGAVRNLRDRRKDLYSLSWTIKKTERDEELLEQGADRLPRASRRKAIARPSQPGKAGQQPPDVNYQSKPRSTSCGAYSFYMPSTINFKPDLAAILASRISIPTCRPTALPTVFS